MSVTTILSGLAFFSMSLGLLDCLMDNRFGLAAELEKGLLSAGRLILIMTGFMTLAPVAAQVLSPVMTPFFVAIGCDPSAFAGAFLANDSGGAALAMEMAIDPDAGLYHGLIVGSMLGSAVMFAIAMTMAYTAPQQRQAAIFGLVCGIITIPLGCIAGGLVAGFDPKMVWNNSIPCIVLSVVLMIALLKLKTKIVPFFTVMGKVMLGISYFGLAVAALNGMLGIQVFEHTTSLNEIFLIIGNISLFLAGAFPLLLLLTKLLKAPLNRISKMLQINETEVSGLIATLANSLATFAILKKMSPRGVMLNLAFIVSASCVFGDHLAYTAQVAKEMVAAVVVGKLVGAATALAAAIWLSSRVELEESKPTSSKSELNTLPQ